MAYDFDLLVIGSGPAGQKAAIQAAKLHRRVAIVEQQRMVGGVCINSGTIPSKTLREAVLFLTGMTQRSMYGDSYRVKDDVTIADLFWRTQAVIQREADVVRDQLSRNHVRILTGTGQFSDAHTVTVSRGGRRAPPGDGGADRDRGRNPAGPPEDRRLQRAHRARLGRHPAPREDPRRAPGRGSRRDRHRVRLDVRGARVEGHRRRGPAAAARLLRRRDRRGAPATTCAT